MIFFSKSHLNFKSFFFFGNILIQEYSKEYSKIYCLLYYRILNHSEYETLIFHVALFPIL